MPKSRRQAAARLTPKMNRVLNAFGRLAVRERRQFVNALTQFTPQADYFRPGKPTRPNLPTAPTNSLTPARVQMSVRMRANPIKGLTFERLVGYLDQWRLGFFRQAGMAWEQMERRDYQLQIVRPKRIKSVARHGYDVLMVEQVADDQKALAQNQRDFLKHFYDHLEATTALAPDEAGGFALLVRQMMDAVGKFYSCHEIVWQPGLDGNLTARFIHCPVWWFEGTTGKLRFLESEFQIYGSDMLPGEWLVTVGDGLMEACSVIYLLKYLPLKSWLAFLDRFASPGIHGKTDAQKGSEEWNDFVSAITDFGEEWATVTNRSAEISLIEAKANGDAGYEKIVELMDRKITQLWRGGDLGTNSSQDGAGASLQGDESEILETDDARMIEETLALKVSRFALAWKFGPEAPQLAYIKLRTTPRRNIQDDLAVDKFLAGLKDAQGRGLLGLETTLERYARPLPKDDDERLGAPTSPAAGGEPQPNDAGFANSALDAAGKRLVLEAVLAEFNGINERLAAIAQITDPEQQKAKLAAVLVDLEKLEGELHHDPAIANAIYKVLVAGLGNGLAKKSKA